MLLEQGVEQFQIWNCRKAPIYVMERALFSGVEKLNNTY
jgi:shikimate 5-dehydrogenase